MSVVSKMSQGIHGDGASNLSTKVDGNDANVCIAVVYCYVVYFCTGIVRSKYQTFHRFHAVKVPISAKFFYVLFAFSNVTHYKVATSLLHIYCSLAVCRCHATQRSFLHVDH